MKKHSLLKTAALTAGAYTLGLHGRKGHPDLELLRKYRFAHRGYHDKPAVPENSLPAFRRAIAHGWGAELDVHLMKDGTLAVIHDSSLLRTAGADVQIEKLTREELENYRLEGTDERIPLFDEVLALFEDAAPLIIELKAAGGNHFALAKAVCERLDTYRGTYCIESFDPAVVADVRTLRPGICRGQLAENFLRDKGALDPVRSVLATSLIGNAIGKPDFIAFRFEDRACLSNVLCLRLWGIQGVAWTLRSKEDLLAAEAEGLIPIFENFDPEA